MEENQIPILPYKKYKLKNGLEVILMEDHRLPLVAVTSGTTWAPQTSAPASPDSPTFSST